MAALVLGLIGTILFAVGEAHQRGLAEQNAQAARDEKREAQFQAYRARLSAAVAALQNHDVTDAARHLDAAPEALRGWEWRHLRSRLDDSIAVIPAPPSGIVLLPGPHGLRVLILANRACASWTSRAMLNQRWRSRTSTERSGSPPKRLTDCSSWTG